MAFQKVLVALDRSAQTSAVFEQALAQTHPVKGQLLLLHTLPISPIIAWGTAMAVDPSAISVLWQVQEQEVQAELEAAQQWLSTYQQQATAQGVTVELNCSVGVPEASICRVAQQWGADLIVVGRRGLRGVAEMLVGSVSNYVLHHAPCPVLTVQDRRMNLRSPLKRAIPRVTMTMPMT